MKLRKILLFGAVLVVAAVWLLIATSTQQTPANAKSVEIAGKTPSIGVETATTPQQWERGLMFRTSLAKDSGMLFIFPAENFQTFWMKNTEIPLDILFISSNLTVVDIKHGFQPCTADPCPIYTSRQPAQYVLEVNAGYCAEHNVAAGDRVLIT